ncbi:MAG: thioredoxin family protein [Phycisphaerales bacterium]|nr:thioredoxin family protein [Phycisphaerales bacterium]
MKIEILGTGCPKCQALADNAKAAADKMGVPYELTKVTQINDIIGRGVMMTPALVIDGEVKVSGQVATEAEITTLLGNAASKES